MIQEGGTSYSQVFADTAVAIEPMPARPKKHKLTIDLGCTPLVQTATLHVTSTVTSQMISQPVTKTVIQPQDSSAQTWSVPKDILRQLPEVVPTVK